MNAISTPAIEDPRALLRHLYDVAVQRALPLHNTAASLPKPPRGRTLVLGAGKAGGAMAQAVEALWPADAPLSGLVVTRYHHTPPRPAGLPPRIEVVEASHPVPDAAGLAAAQRILQLTQGLTSDDLVLCLISGGGSSLLTLPADGLTLEDKQRINRQLLASGAPIGDMNTVRKHLSAIKGGRLAAACAPARVVTLTISDVPGDDPSIIASGPTVPDASTCADALAIFDHAKGRHPEGEITVIGRSLGSGVASYVAAERPVSKLVLVTPFDSLAAVAAGHYPWLPVDWLLQDRYDAGRHLADFTGPLLVIRAGNDRVVPPARTDALVGRHLALWHRRGAVRPLSRAGLPANRA